MKVQSWDNDELVKKTLRKRFEAAKKYREKFEAQMQMNDAVVNNAKNPKQQQPSIGFTGVIEGPGPEDDQADSEMGTNLVFKYLRFIHSQMSANPPSVAAKATTTDQVDRRSADAADRIARHLARVHDLQEVIDQSNLQTLTYSIGWVKVCWDPNKGDVSQFDKATNEIVMSGDISVYSPDTDDIWLDPDARNLSDIKYVFEAIHMTLDDAMAQFPEQAAKIKECVGEKRNYSIKSGQEHEEQVTIFEYHERGEAINGMAGRFVRFLEDYTLLGKAEESRHPSAKLSYHPLTYIDAPKMLYGKSVVEYAIPLQDMLNKVDSSAVDAIQAHGLVRLAVPSGANLEDGAMTSSNWDYVTYDGPQNKPTYIPAPQLMQEMWLVRNNAAMGIQDLFGINDSQLGVQKREQSAVSQQTAIEQGTLIHRRLFKKYERLVYSVYQNMLELVQKNWTLPRTVMIVGKENAFECKDFAGADIAHGFDLKVEYGASLPLDPNLRREALMLLKNTMLEAGMSSKQFLQYLKLNDMEGIFDIMELAAERQREDFEEMIARVEDKIPPEEAYIAPESGQEHKGRLDFAYTYVETVDFKYLPDITKELLRQHIREREAMLAADIAKKNAPPPTEPAKIPGMPGAEGAITPTVGRKAGGLSGPAPGGPLAALGIA